MRQRNSFRHLHNFTKYNNPPFVLKCTMKVVSHEEEIYCSFLGFKYNVSKLTESLRSPDSGHDLENRSRSLIMEL